MELPALDALRSALPRAHITALGAGPAVDLLAGDARVDAVETLDRFDLRHRWDVGEPRTRPALTEWLNERRFDLFLDVHHTAPPVGEVVWRGVRSLEADEGVEAQAVRNGADAVEAMKAAVWAGWGLQVHPDAAPDLRLREDERRFAAVFLLAHGLSGARPIGISPAASAPLKRWPLERLAQAAGRLAETSGRPILLFEGPGQDSFGRVQAALPPGARLEHVAGLPLRQVAALLERCGVLVCSDTGLLHVAAAVETPVIGAFGPTVPEIVLPNRPTAFAVGGVGIECPYRNTESLHPPGCWASDRCFIAEESCVLRVSVDDVVAAAIRALAGATRRTSHVPPAVAPSA